MTRRGRERASQGKEGGKKKNAIGRSGADKRSEEATKGAYALMYFIPCSEINLVFVPGRRNDGLRLLACFRVSKFAPAFGRLVVGGARAGEVR